MVFNDTTNKNGIIQNIEFWTRMPDGTISGDATLLKQFTARVNAGFDRIMPFLLSYTDHIRWDDINHTDKPVATFATQSGVSSYKITEDDNSLDILNIIDVKILTSSTATEYSDLERMTADNPDALYAISPNVSQTGVPSKWVELGNRINFDRKFDYVNSTGIKIFFEREQSYFASTDTTKEPGIPKPFHELLVLYPSLDWNRVNRTEDSRLLNELKEEIFKYESNLRILIEKRNPTRRIIKPKITPFI